MDPITQKIALGASGAGGAESYWFTIYYDEDYSSKPVSVTTDSTGNVLVGAEVNADQFGHIPSAWGNAIIAYDKDGSVQYSKTNKIAGNNVQGRKQDVAVDSNNNAYIVGDVPFHGPVNGSYVYGGGFIAKYNSSGTRQWHKKFGPTNDNLNYSAVRVDSNDNVYVAGRSRVNFGNWNFWLVKYNTSGAVQENKKITGSSAMELEFQCLELDSNDNIYMTGVSGSDAIVLKLNSSLALQWSRAYASSSYPGDRIAVDGSGNVFIHTDRAAHHIVKYNSSGVLQWQRAVSSSNSYDGGLAADADGNVYFTGTSFVSGYGSCLHIVKITSSGTLDWARFIYGGVGVYGRGCHHDNDSVYVTARISDSNGYLYDFVGKIPDDGSLTGTFSTTDFSTITYANHTGTTLSTPTNSETSHSATVADNPSFTESNSGMTEYSFTRPNEENIEL